MDGAENKTKVTVIGHMTAAADACECGNSCGCTHDTEGEGCGTHDHGECHGCNGHSIQIPSDMEQFHLLKDYIAHVDMVDEIELMFLAWEEESAEKSPRIAELMAQGYELPMVSIDGTLRLAGAVDPAKVVTMVNQHRAELE